MIKPFSFSYLALACAAAAIVTAFDVTTAAAQQRPAAQRGSAGASGGDDEEGGGRRMSTIDTARLEVAEDMEITIVSPNRLLVTSPEYAKVETMKPGEVIELTQSPAIKLKNPVDLTFGETVIKKENVAPNYPGVYGLWLKKTEAGWNLVFNEKADVWGTMYDASSDAAAVPVEYTFTEEQAKSIATLLVEQEQNKEAGDRQTPRLTVALEKTDNGGLLKINWGAHTWSAPFTYGS